MKKVIKALTKFDPQKRMNVDKALEFCAQPNIISTKNVIFLAYIIIKNRIIIK